MTRVGVISDTHGLVRPEALAALAGVDHLLHAGDVGRPQVLDALRPLAPLTVVRGNVDHGTWADALPETAEVEIAGVWFHVRHILEDLDVDPAAAGFDVVVVGHSHRPAIDTRPDGVVVLNPGSAGPRRFTLPVTVAVVEIADATPHATIVELL